MRRTASRKAASPDGDGMPDFVIRDARAGDHRTLLRLARILAAVNLPMEAADLRRVLAQSQRSFRRSGPHADAVHVFVIEDRRSRRIAGSSMIIAKHGTPESPHYYLDMLAEERYSRTLRKMFHHTSLHLRHSMDGPVEVGGLVVDPRYRRHPARVGTQLSFVRFLYIAMHRDRFGHEVIAEMKPPLTATGESRFWQCYGGRVTGLTFQEADRLSSKDKEFIPALFPGVPIYTCMLPVDVQQELGQVGPDTVGAVRLLEKIGFRFLHQIDPFDAGPYYGARIDDVTLVRDFRRVRLVPEAEVGPPPKRDLLVGVGQRGFLAFRASARLVEDTLFLAPRLLEELGLRANTPAGVVPFA